MENQEQKKGQIQIFAKNIKGKARGKIQEDSKITKNIVEGNHVQNGGGGVNNDVNTERKQLKIGRYFESAIWTNHKDEPIKRAIYGQTVRLNIIMNKEYVKVGEEVQFKLYNVDKSTKKETLVGLVNTKDNKIGYDRVKIQNIGGKYKAIIIFTLTPDNLDKELPPYMKNHLEWLYCRCSYQSEHKDWEHKQIPKKQADYLEMGVLVIDRYKMPGLKPDGSDIADDMTYGTGHPHKKLIYSADRRSKYTEEYKTFGFDVSKHALFADAEDDVLMEPYEIEEVVVTNKKQEEYKAPVDHTAVYITKFPTPTEERNALKKVRNKNVKAIYTKEQCYSTKYGIISTGLDVRIFDNLSDEQLFWDFENTAEFYFARGELQGNLNRMIAKFRQNNGGIYEDEVLTRNIKDHPETIAYCQKVEDYIAEQLKSNFRKLEEVEDKDPYFLVGEDFKNAKNNRDKKFSKPSYSYGNPIEATKGLTIATNDIWSAEVVLKEVKFSGDNYTGKYEVTLWDHFGLDLPDMEKKFNIIPSVGEVFVCWFILQHLRGYKPFITKITFTKEFTGNLQKGKSELEAEREKQREEDARELNEKIQQDIWTSPKI
ncbi:DUF3289 family protein [Chryseobacterium sp.]|jgi:hypothetical protein|uniref:DUF3289 family protein n=1 Tax=Chryseobacterium sp. TaxID=1871047 RepID=UPI002844B4EA|nr:DUF3289 family protein [Chryseobacterium sp.]MDR3025149.1 DUF3289 family protein [Chryseobacterium sp.]